MEEKNDSMQAIVLLNKNIKLNNINNIKVIRVKDEKYNLLIMRDYWPIIGEINGNIYFDGDENISFENIKGFYMLCNNVFRLIIIEND